MLEYKFGIGIALAIRLQNIWYAFKKNEWLLMTHGECMYRSNLCDFNHLKLHLIIQMKAHKS